MLVGDFLDAMVGYNEGELERVKSLAELMRKSTSLLWNTQVEEQFRCQANELWIFPWDKNYDKKIERIPEEEKKRRQEAQDKWLMEHFPN